MPSAYKAQEIPAQKIMLDYAVRLTRTGLAMRLVEPNGRYATAAVDRSLAELLVQARKWWARLAEGKMTIAALAREEVIDDSWISRVVRNFLAPERDNRSDSRWQAAR